MEDWTNDCELLDFINIDVCFCINEDFYYGPHDIQSMEERKETSPLPPVTNKGVANFNLRSLKAEEHPEKLLDYYREVLRLAKNYGKKPIEITQYFWLKLYIWRPDKHISLNFPWYDSLNEMAPILEKIASDEEGMLFQDADLDWDIEIVAQDGFIYIREGNFEEGEINAMLKTPRARLAIDCAEALARARALIGWLSDEIGEDYWTKAKYPADFVTG